MDEYLAEWQTSKVNSKKQKRENSSCRLKKNKIVEQSKMDKYN